MNRASCDSARRIYSARVDVEGGRWRYQFVHVCHRRCLASGLRLGLVVILEDLVRSAVQLRRPVVLPDATLVPVTTNVSSAVERLNDEMKESSGWTS